MAPCPKSCYTLLDMNQPHNHSDSDRQQLEATLRLSLVSGVGPRIRQTLLERFGSVEAIFGATHDELLSTTGVGPKPAAGIRRAINEIDVPSELARCHRNNIDLIADYDDRYPRLLREIVDPPGLLFVRGTLAPGDSLSIAIVGSRHATRYGLAVAGRLASGLSHAGLTVVSGLARGIDAAAHRGALSAGGRTVAVLGGGLMRMYPKEHTKLAEQIAGQGAVISEMPPTIEPFAGSFPQRNRIVTGLSLGTIVVEAAQRSGALISARHANEQGREVFAVPGRVDSRMSQGCHRLIRDGAKLVETVDDVLEELGPLFEPTTDSGGHVVRHPAELQLSELERQVLQAIDTEPTSIDTVATQSGLPVHRVLSTISVLEMRKLIQRVSGNSIVRV